MTTASISWERKGSASVLEVDELGGKPGSGDRIKVLSTEAFAPGTPLRAQLTSGHCFTVKVQRCVRQTEPAGFVITGRLVDATRDARVMLLQLASGGVTNE